MLNNPCPNQSIADRLLDPTENFRDLTDMLRGIDTVNALKIRKLLKRTFFNLGREELRSRMEKFNILLKAISNNPIQG